MYVRRDGCTDPIQIRYPSKGPSSATWRHLKARSVFFSRPTREVAGPPGLENSWGALSHLPAQSPFGPERAVGELGRPLAPREAPCHRQRPGAGDGGVHMPCSCLCVPHAPGARPAPFPSCSALAIVRQRNRAPCQLCPSLPLLSHFLACWPSAALLACPMATPAAPSAISRLLC